LLLLELAQRSGEDAGERIFAGASQQQLDCLAAWQETSCFDERTRAALAWCESLTLLRETRAPRELYDEALLHFSEHEMADLTLIAAAINAWNRIGVGFRLAPAG